MRKIFSYLNQNWLYIVTVLTAVALARFYYEIHFVENITELLKGNEKLVIPESEEASLGYATGLKLGILLKSIVHLFYGAFGLLGLTILFGEFQYKVIFKELFVSSGNSGKFFFFILSLLLSCFVFFSLKLSFPVADRRLSVLGYSTAIIIIGGIIYSVVRYVNHSFTSLRELSYAKTQAELSALKAQINPHFLFNVLNNLYGQAIVEESPKTAEGIQNLSRIMRHVVEETKTQRSPLEKEILFIEDYLKLQRMRIPKRPNIDIKLNINWDKVEAQIAPLMVIPYIENAFKYGISINDACFVHMDFTVKAKTLTFSIENSIVKQKDKLEFSTNTGLENTKKRLQLHYPDRHELTVKSVQGTFTVKLKIHL